MRYYLRWNQVFYSLSSWTLLLFSKQRNLTHVIKNIVRYERTNRFPPCPKNLIVQIEMNYKCGMDDLSSHKANNHGKQNANY